MDQMCSKCEIHCFSHKLWKLSELRNYGKFLNFRKFLKKIFCLNLFFSKIFFDKKVFSDNFFQRIFFYSFQDHYTVLQWYVKKQPILLKFHCKNPEMYRFHCFQDHYTLFKWNCQIKFRMAKNGCSKFFPTIFPKMTGINSEWPKMAILNFFLINFPKKLV